MSRTTQPPPAWPDGAGEMAERIRALDWAATPLGPIDTWPQGLRTALDIILAMPAPATILWGPGQVQLYNDAYITVARDRHPALLGRPVVEGWSDAYEVIAPLIEAAQAGRATRLADFPVALRGPDGRLEMRAFDTDWSPIRDETGAVAGVLQTLVEVTARDRAEAALRDSEERFRALVVAGSYSVYRMSPDWRQMIELQGREFLADTASPTEGWSDAYILPEDLELVRRAIEDAIRDKRMFELEHRVRRANGSIGWTSSRAIPILDEHGEITEWFGAASDITERARAEAALRESEGRLAAAFESVPVGMAVIDTDGRAVIVNESYRRFLPTGLIPSRDPDHLERWRAWDAEGRPIEQRDFPGSRALRGESVTPGQDMLHTDGDGREIWTKVATAPVRDAAGQVTGTVSVIEDIDVLRRSTEALRESEERHAFLLKFSDALRTMSDAQAIASMSVTLVAEHMRLDRAYVAVVDKSRDRAEIGPEYRRPGLTPVEGVLTLSDFPDAFAQVEAHTLVLDDTAGDPSLSDLDRRSFAALEMRALIVASARIGAGNPVWALLVATTAPRQWTSGEIALVEEVAERTWAAMERARAEAALRESEEKYRTLFDTMGQGYCELELIRDDNGRVFDQLYLELNPAFERLFGVPAAQAKGRRASEVFPRLEQGWHDAFDRVARTEAPERIEHRLAPLDRWFEVFAYPRGGDRLSVLYEDVTERKQAENALRASEGRLRSFAETSSDVLWIVDAETGRLEYLSPAYETVWGEPRDAVMADLGHWATRVHPDDRVRAGEALEGLRAGRRRMIEYRIVRPDGEVRFIQDTGFPIMRDGKVVRLAGVAQDLTERHLAERAVAQAEQRARTLMEGVPQLVWRAVDGGNWTWASPQWTTFTGQPEAESHELGWLDAVHPDDRDAAREAWAHAVETGGFEVEYRIRRAADGAYRWFQTRATPVRDETSAIAEWLGTSTDVHELRELQGRQQVLVAELQHRVRNILTVIRSVFGRTAETGGDLEEIADHFRGRLDALARTQVIATADAQGEADLENLVRDELLSVGVSDGAAVRIEGPEVRLSSKAAESMGLALHELTTNALKYGALKTPGGKLDITWSVNPGYGGARRVDLTWTEQGVPAIPFRPSRQGFGRELIEEALPYRLGAETKLEFRGGGVRCHISLPVPDTGAAPTLKG